MAETGSFYTRHTEKLPLTLGTRLSLLSLTWPASMKTLRTL